MVNRGGFSDRLGGKVTVNGDLTKAGHLTASVNRLTEVVFVSDRLS